MKKKVVLWTGLWSLVVSTLAFGAVTFAWINYHQPLSGTTIVSGDMSFSKITTEVYRYDYPTFTGTSLVDYTSAGTISEHTVSSSDYTIQMNKFDPTYILLAHAGVVNKASISDLFTNVVLKLSATLTYSVPTDYSLFLQKNSSYVSAVDADGIQHYGISNYLNFVGLTSEVFNELSTDKTDASEQIFYKVKNYALTATESTFPATSSASIDLFSTSISTRPVGQKSVDITAYLNVDFDSTLTAPFFSAANLGRDFILDMDYSLTWKASERN